MFQYTSSDQLSSLPSPQAPPKSSLNNKHVTSDNGYETGSVSRESAVSGDHPPWPLLRSVGVSASLDDIPDLPESFKDNSESFRDIPESFRGLGSPLPVLEDDETLLSPLCYDPPFDQTFRNGFIPDPRFSGSYNFGGSNYESTPHVRRVPDYPTLMRLCGEGDANALDSFLSVNPDSLKRPKEQAYLGVMTDLKTNSMRIASAESVRMAEPQVIISPIVSAILGGNSECVRLLVEAGASVNSPNGISDNMVARADCPLSCALRVDRMDVAEYLVSQGAHVGESLLRLSGCTDPRLANMLAVRLGKTVNVTESRDPDMQALWRLISQQILVLTPAPLETAFLLGRAFRLLACARPALTSHWERLGTACERFSVQLIDQCLSPQEVSAIMTREADSRQSAPIHDALYYGRKEFVSHPATYGLLKQRITRNNSATPQIGDVFLSLAAPLVLPFLTIISYVFCGIRRDSLLRKYMYRVYSPFALFTTSIAVDFLLLLLVTCCCIASSNQSSISYIEILTWVVALGVLVAETERRKLVVWYYQFRFVCDLLTFTWLVSILLLKLRMLGYEEDWTDGIDAVQLIYGILLVTLAVRFLSVVRPILPCNPLCVLNQLLPDFCSYVAVLGFLYLVFNVAIHTVYVSTAISDHISPTFLNICFLSLQRVVTTPGDGAPGAIAAQLLFICFVFLALLTFIAFSISCLGKIQTTQRGSTTERRCSVMRLVMMHEGNHPIPAPFNLLTWPGSLIARHILCTPCKKGIKKVVWGEGDYHKLYNTSLHDKQDTVAKVCSRLQPPQKGGEETDSYEAILTLREDLYKLYSKMDSEGIKLDALQSVWKSFVGLQDNLVSLQTQVKSLVTDGDKNNTLLLEQNDRMLGLSKLLRESKTERCVSRGSSSSTGGRFSDI